MKYLVGKLGNRVVVREGGFTPPAPFYYSMFLDKYLKTTLTVNPPHSDICFIVV
jgi:hypothetical protein